MFYKTAFKLEEMNLDQVNALESTSKVKHPPPTKCLLSQVHVKYRVTKCDNIKSSSEETKLHMSPNVACTESADDTCKMTQMIITPQMGNICTPSGHKDGHPPPVFHTNISSAKALPALRCAKSRHLRKLLIGSCHFPPTSESCTRFIGYNVNVSS